MVEQETFQMPIRPKDEHLFPPEFAARMFRDDGIYRERCKAQCREWARANQTDPHVYLRALNEYACGIAYAGPVGASGSLFAGAQGYNVMWSQEPRTARLGDIVVEFYVPIPINLKRP